MNKLWLTIIAAQLSAFGHTISAMDTDGKGTDHVIGLVLTTAGNALTAFANNNTKSFKSYLKLIADTINDYLNQNQSGAESPPTVATG